jgi:hypothetical protein
MTRRVKKGLGLHEGFVISEKNDIMKGEKKWSLLNDKNNQL